MLKVAIGGSSCSGKSVLSNWLSELLGCSVIHQDKFYKLDQDIPIVNGLMDWDCPDAIDFDGFKAFLLDISRGHVESKLGANRPTIDANQIDDDFRTRMEALVHKIKRNLGGKKLILIDGYMLYLSEEIERLFDLKLFLHAPRAELENRRMKRPKYLTEQGTWSDPPEYFDLVVWPNYLKYNQRVFSNQNSYEMIDTLKSSVQDVIVLALQKILDLLTGTI